MEVKTVAADRMPEEESWRRPWRSVCVREREKVNFRDHMLIGAPPNSLGLANPSSWMSNRPDTDFVKTMQHCIKFAYSTMDNPLFLIYDNHESHIDMQLTKRNDTLTSLFTIRVSAP